MVYLPRLYSLTLSSLANRLCEMPRVSSCLQREAAESNAHIHSMLSCIFGIVSGYESNIMKKYEDHQVLRQPCFGLPVAYHLLQLVQRLPSQMSLDLMYQDGVDLCAPLLEAAVFCHSRGLVLSSMRFRDIPSVSSPTISNDFVVNRTDIQRSSVLARELLLRWRGIGVPETS